MPTSNGKSTILRDPDATVVELRKTLSKPERIIVRDSMAQLEKDLILSLDEMRTGVASTRTQSSLQSTIALTPRGKKYPKDLKLRVESRVSAKRPGFVSEYHLDDDNQLQMDFMDIEDEDDAGDPPAFDSDAPPATPPMH